MATKAIPSDASSIFPNTVRENHCTVEDWFRYIGVGASFLAAGWCVVNGSKIPGAMALVSGAMIVVLHITDKTCGARAKIIRAAKERFQGYTSALQEAEQTKAERDSLLTTKTDPKQGKHSVGAEIARLEAENRRLRAYAATLEKQFQAKNEMLVSLQSEVDQILSGNIKTTSQVSLDT